MGTMLKHHGQMSSFVIYVMHISYLYFLKAIMTNQFVSLSNNSRALSLGRNYLVYLEWQKSSYSGGKWQTQLMTMIVSLSMVVDSVNDRLCQCRLL